MRGGAGLRFRQDVTAHYAFRCLFTGQRLPRTTETGSAGVDAAHILPWSTHNINSVTNGLCLSKQCHWAFDEGLLRLSYDDSEGSYIVSIPNPVMLAAQAEQFDIESFASITGRIPESRLPANAAFWPSRDYLISMNRFLDSDAA